MREILLEKIKMYEERVQTSGQEYQKLEQSLNNKRNELVTLQGAHAGMVQLAIEQGFITEDGKLVEDKQEEPVEILYEK